MTSIEPHVITLSMRVMVLNGLSFSHIITLSMRVMVLNGLSFSNCLGAEDSHARPKYGLVAWWRWWKLRSRRIESNILLVGTKQGQDLLSLTTYVGTFFENVCADDICANMLRNLPP